MGARQVDRTAGLNTAARHAHAFLNTLDERPVAARLDAPGIHTMLGGPVPEHGEDPTVVIDALVEGADPGLVASAGPRHFGFVVGGALPAALAADWLVSAWDQNAILHVLSPAIAAIEDITSAWVLDLLDLPSTASVGFVTGGQGANTTCLAAARHAVLARAGWDVKQNGLTNAPTVRVICGEQAHVTIDTALRLLGFGTDTTIRIAADDQGRMNPEALQKALTQTDGPMIVCAQAGNVATGCFDAFEPIADACARHNAWLHIDGAFGLWAATVPSLRQLTQGVEQANSWAVDAHKWLNVPYDSGMAIVADPAAHVAAMHLTAPYLTADENQRDGGDYVLESSRRGRAVPVYAAIRSLGRSGIAELIERNCAQARHMAERLATIPGAEVLNDIVLNQLLIRLPGGDDANRAAVAAIQCDGTCWLGGTTWRGQYVLRVSICNWATTNDDIDRSADAITLAAQQSSPQPGSRGRAMSDVCAETVHTAGSAVPHLGDLSRFAPVADPRPHDESFPAMSWPVADDTVLTGELVQLSALNPTTDADELLRTLDHDEVWAHVPGRPRNPRHFREVLAERCSLADWHPWLIRTRCAIAGLPAGTIVGTTSYVDAHPQDAWLEVGYTLYTPAVWATAVNPEAKLLLFGYAFDTLGAGRIQLKTDVRNHRSQQAIARLGTKYEGTLRRSFRREDGTIRDSVLFSVTVEDWPDVRHRLTERVHRAIREVPH